MRSRRRLTWLIFGVCALLVIDGLGWVTWEGIRLERREREAELIRLALWRMDSELSPLLAGEASRPYFQYRSFYPAERAYTKMWEEILPNEVLVPSPLLEKPGPLIRLHFEVGQDGAVRSPQAPEGNMRDQAESTYASEYQIRRAGEDLVELARILGAGDPTIVSRALRDRELAPANEPGAYSDEVSKQFLKNDYTARQQVADAARGWTQSRAPVEEAPAQLGLGAQRQGDDEARSIDLGEAGTVLKDASVRGRQAQDVVHGPLRAVWRDRDEAAAKGVGPREAADPELLFLRDVRVGREETLQGFWIDWPAMQATLTASIADLFPQARLVPVRGGLEGESASRILAAVPIVIEPGPISPGAGSIVALSRLPLIVTWFAVLGAILAIGIVLRAAMGLSERRGRFVSAVTHELRTPLTTFCLYSQMLADGMVRDEPKRKEYLSTLRQEAERLARIVENVLEFARLGERRPSPGAKLTDPGAVLERLMPVLRQRAEQAGMTIRYEDAVGPGPRLVRLEPEAFERVVTNLVDNACKYACESDNREIVVHLDRHDGRIRLSVADHGPGIPPGETDRIFQPFHRAPRDSNGSKSGLGLGLSLARGLARQAGGELSVAPGNRPGAVFRLILPLA